MLPQIFSPQTWRNWSEPGSNYRPFADRISTYCDLVSSEQLPQDNDLMIPYAAFHFSLRPVGVRTVPKVGTVRLAFTKLAHLHGSAGRLIRGHNSIRPWSEDEEKATANNNNRFSFIKKQLEERIR